MPISARVRLPHVRALDGVRGAAVAAVLLFHGGVLEGGYLGVDLFFVLSGFLITSLLLAEGRETGAVSLVGFWARRARRLLPALFLVLVAVGAYAVLVAEPTELGRIRDDALATIGYVANWRFVLAGFDYWALFSDPSPLAHTWSLAIEEQFYLLWPLVFAGVLGMGGRPGNDDAHDVNDRHGANQARKQAANQTARRMLVVSLGLGLAFAFLALALWFRTEDTTRVYYGTDTRAPSILFGASLGALLAWRGPVRSRRGRVSLEGVALLSAAFLTVAWLELSGENLYRGGLLLSALAGVAVVAAVVHPEPGPLSRVFSLRPVVGLGLISYGAYLWHWPVYVWLDERRVGLSGWPLLGIRLAVTLAFALVSYRFVEQPVRRGAFGPSTLRWLAPVAAGALIAVTLVSTLGAVEPADAVTSGIVSPSEAVRAAADDPSARRLMVVGNSVAYYLAGEGFTDLRARPRTVVLNAASTGCDFPASARVRFDDVGSGRDAIDCRELWGEAVEQFRPEVVLVTFSDSANTQLLRDGQWVTPCSDTYRRWYPRALGAAVGKLDAGGAHVVLTTSAYSRVFSDGPHARAQTDCTNRLVRDFASAHPEVGLVDLGAFVCPTFDGCRSEVAGEPLRRDGVHYAGSGARWIARWLLPQLGFDRAARKT